MEWAIKRFIVCMVLVCFMGNQTAYAKEPPLLMQDTATPIYPMTPFLFVFGVARGLMDGISASRNHTYSQEELDGYMSDLHAEDQQVLDILQAACDGENTVDYATESGRIRDMSIFLGTAPTCRLPEEISLLQNLTNLEIEIVDEQARYAAPLPDSLFAMPSLKTLVLWNYNWPLPEDLSGLTHLEDLTFWHGTFNTLPESIGKLSALKSLSIYHNTQISLPETLGDLQNLTLLYITNTAVQNLPNSLGHLSSLRFLNLTDTQISSLPESFGELTKLESLILAKNTLSSLPAGITNFHNLKALDVGSNKLTEEVFTLLAPLPALERVNLHGNLFAGPLPEAFFAMPSLEYLNLSGNNFSGHVPASLMDSPRLHTLILSDNPGLTGQLLPFMQKNLEILAIHRTGLQYAPEDKKLQTKESYTPFENPDVVSSFTFTPDKANFFLIPNSNRIQLYSDNAFAPMWGENIQLILSVDGAFLPEYTPEKAPQLLAKLSPSIEQTIQKLAAIPKQDILNTVVNTFWSFIETYNSYGTLEDTGYYPIKTKEDFLQYIQIKSVLIFVDEEKSSRVSACICMTEDAALFDEFPFCINVNDGKLETSEITFEYSVI